MKDTFPLRLRSARKQIGYSRKKLSEELGELVSSNLIKQFEDGKKQPSSNVLLALSEALKVKIDYFSRPIRFELGDIEFRKKASLGKKQIESIKGKTLDLLERYVEVERLANIESTFQNPLSENIIQSEKDVEAAAEQLRESWELGTNAIPNVVQMLEEHEVKVLEIDGPIKFDGLSTFVQNIPVTLLNQSFPVERKRFTALHELGHLTLNIPTDKDPEPLCNQFAGAMLITREEMEQALGKRRTGVPKMVELITIKEAYGISIQAIMRRAYDLDIINKPVYEQFCRKIARHRTEEGLGQFKGDEKAFRFKQLIFRLAAEEQISMSKAASLAGMNLATFREAFYQNQEKGIADWSIQPELTNFAQAYSDDEPDYDFADLIEINPDYDPR